MRFFIVHSPIRIFFFFAIVYRNKENKIYVYIGLKSIGKISSFVATGCQTFFSYIVRIAGGQKIDSYFRHLIIGYGGCV